jgi:glutamate synthase domain-containing protein 3
LSGAATGDGGAGVAEEDEDIDFVRAIIARHAEITRSRRAAYLLSAWLDGVPFDQGHPADYKRILIAEARARSKPRTGLY